MVRAAHLRPVEHHLDAVVRVVRGQGLRRPDRLDCLRDEPQIIGSDRNSPNTGNTTSKARPAGDAHRCANPRHAPRHTARRIAGRSTPRPQSRASCCARGSAQYHRRRVGAPCAPARAPGERESLEASKTDVALAAIERVSEHPAFRPASADLQTEAAAVTVEARGVERLHLSARQRPNAA